MDGKGKKIAEIQSRKGRKAKNTESRLYRDKHGNYITYPGKSYKQINLKDCEFLHHNNN